MLTVQREKGLIQLGASTVCTSVDRKLVLTNPDKHWTLVAESPEQATSWASAVNAGLGAGRHTARRRSTRAALRGSLHEGRFTGEGGLLADLFILTCAQY